MDNRKNIYGNNVGWICADSAISLLESKEQGSFLIDDEVEIYGENEAGEEGSVSICVTSLLESASVVIDEKDSYIEKLESVIDEIIKSDFSAKHISAELERLVLRKGK